MVTLRAVRRYTDHLFVPAQMPADGVTQATGLVQMTCAVCHSTFLTHNPGGCCPIQRCGTPLRYRPAPPKRAAPGGV